MENKILSACQHIYGGYAIYVKAVAELWKSRSTFFLQHLWIYLPSLRKLIEIKQLVNHFPAYITRLFVCSKPNRTVFLIFFPLVFTVSVVPLNSQMPHPRDCTGSSKQGSCTHKEVLPSSYCNTRCNTTQNCTVMASTWQQPLLTHLNGNTQQRKLNWKGKNPTGANVLLQSSIFSMSSCSH